MSRKPLLYTDEYPYHVVARSNNREWFYLHRHEVWNVIANNLNKLTKQHKIKVHAFVLMDNHYHMLVTMSEKIDLGKFMQLLQRSVSRSVNCKARRINHVFGGPYKGCLISSPQYYAHVVKYIFRNPVKANIVNLVEEYPFSTLRSDQEVSIRIAPHNAGFAEMIPDRILNWLNQPATAEQNEYVGKALKRTSFSLALKSEKYFQ